MRGNEVEGSVEIGAKRNERNAVTEWTRMNEATECTLAIKNLCFIFFCTAEKGGWGAWFLGGVGWQEIRLPFYQNGYGIGYLT